MYRNHPNNFKFEPLKVQGQSGDNFTGKIKVYVTLFCSISFAVYFDFCVVIIEMKRNESTANDHNMISNYCPVGNVPVESIESLESVASSTDSKCNMTANFSIFTTLTNNSAFFNHRINKNECSNSNNNWTQSISRSTSLSTSNTTNSSPTSTCSTTIDSASILPHYTFRDVFNNDMFCTQQLTSTQITSCNNNEYDHESKCDTNSTFDNLTIHQCAGCHFVHKDFVSDVKNRPTYDSYFRGAEITDLMLKNSIVNVKIPTKPPAFNIQELNIVSDGYNRVGYFMFDQVLQLCSKNMNQQKYGVNFGSVVKFRLILKESNVPITFAPFLIKWTTSKKNASSSDQLSKCKSFKMSTYQKKNHLIGINIKPNTVTTFNGRSQEDVKIGICFDEFLADGQIVWQYACIDQLQQKKCYFEACKNSPRKSRQKKKIVKRNHIVSLQLEKKTSSYIPILLLRKDEQFSKTIAKIQSKIYFKNLPNYLFDLFATIE